MQGFGPTSTNAGNPVGLKAGVQPGQLFPGTAGRMPSTSLASTPAGAGSPATSTAAITANDFLQLLVTELKNQDPTANVDPNEYVNQLVQVNSLQQEIQMNQTLDGGPTLTGASSGLLQQLMQMNNTLDGDLAGSSSSSAEAKPAAEAAVPVQAGKSSQTVLEGGQNAVSNPSTQASAEAIANALAPHVHQVSSQSGEALQKLQIPASQVGAFAKFAASLRANSMSGRNR